MACTERRSHRTELAGECAFRRRPLELLSLDCEGCEWGVLDELFCRHAERHGGVPIRHLIAEFHFQASLSSCHDWSRCTHYHCVTVSRRVTL